MDTRKVATVLKAVSAATRDAMTASNSAARRAVNAVRLVAMMLKVMFNKLRAAIQVEVRPVTVKARRADERDTGKAEREIDAGPLKDKRTINRRDTRRDHRTVVRLEPTAISVRLVVIKTIKRRRRLNRSPPTTISAEVVVALSRTTRPNRHSINGRRDHHAR